MEVREQLEGSNGTRRCEHMEKKVRKKATQKALVREYQNLNSGSLRDTIVVVWWLGKFRGIWWSGGWRMVYRVRSVIPAVCMPKIREKMVSEVVLLMSVVWLCSLGSRRIRWFHLVEWSMVWFYLCAVVLSGRWVIGGWRWAIGGKW